MRYSGNTAQKYYRRWFFICLGLLAFYETFALIALDPKTDGWTIVLAGLIFMPMVIYYLGQWIYYRYLKIDEVYEAQIEATESYGRRVGLVFCIEVDGVKLRRTSKHVFTTDLLGPNRIDDFLGTTAKVGFNPKRDEYIVL